MSVVIIGGGKAHEAIHELTQAAMAGKLSPEQLTRRDELYRQLHELAQELVPK